MKKIIAVVLTLSLMIGCIGTISASAIVAPEDAMVAFDISQYAIDDLIEMNIEERKLLLDNFIETYNPYGIRDLMTENNIIESNSDADLQWDSGRNLLGTEQEIATHQLITLEAFARFIEKHGFYSDADGTDALVISLLLAAGSGLPDMDETDLGFVAHFYDPDSGENFLGQDDPTAKTKTGSHYNIAYNILSSNFHMDLLSDDFARVMEELGRALHYLQDLCEPHHASNKIAVLTNHTDFEDYVEDNIETILGNSPSSNCYYHSIALNNSTQYLAHYAATIAKPKYEIIKNDENFYSVGYSSVWESVYFSEALIYKLFYECSIA